MKFVCTIILALLPQLSSASEAITLLTLPGEYHLQSNDTRQNLQLLVQKNSVRLQFTQNNRLQRCEGKFEWNERELILFLDFASCAGMQKISYELYLAGQTMETLRQKTYIMVNIKKPGQDSYAGAFAIQRMSKPNVKLNRISSNTSQAIPAR